jgi:hypothetical protein
MSALNTSEFSVNVLFMSLNMYDVLQVFLHYFASQNRKTVKNPQKEADAANSSFPTKYLSGEEDTITFLNVSVPGFLVLFLMAYATANSQ